MYSWLLVITTIYNIIYVVIETILHVISQFMKMGFQSHTSFFLAIFFSLALLSSMVTTIQARVVVGLVRAPPPATPTPPPPMANGYWGGCVPCWDDEKGNKFINIL